MTRQINLGRMFGLFDASRRRRGAASVVAAVGIAATGLIAPAGSASTRPGSFAACVGNPATTTEASPSPRLLSMLGILRRPQTAGDALPPVSHGGLLPGGAEGVYIHYVRLARVVSGSSYYLVPVAKACGSGAEEVFLNVRSPPDFSGYGGATASLIEHGRFHGSQGLGVNSVVYGVVPDGVAKVTLTYAPSGPNSISPSRQPGVTVTTRPVNNVFVVRVHQDPGSASLPKTIVWRSAKGKVIKRIQGSG
jgi:hypothetical protein